MNLFVTGTDTGVGKTYVTARLVAALRGAGHDVAAMKPICCGDRDDADQLFEACGGKVALNDINPVWYRTPVAPYTAAMVENRPVDFALIGDRFRFLRERHASVIVEGVGGWMVPLERSRTVADLAQEWDLPVAVVVANRLGALNHALLTVRDIRNRGLPFAGIIWNEPDLPSDVAQATNASILEELLGEPFLFTMGHGSESVSLSSVRLR